MLPFFAAMATPPDTMDANAHVLCGGAGQLAFLLQTRGNLGAHHYQAWNLRLMRLDTASRTFDAVRQAGLVDSFLDGDPPDRSWSPSAATSIGPTLKAWGVKRCPLRPGLGELEWRLDGANLVVTLDDTSRVLPLTWLDPRGDDWWKASMRYDDKTWTASAYEDTVDPENPDQGLEVLAVYDLDTAVVVHAHWRLDLDRTDMLGVVPGIRGARSYLYNSRALAHHRARDGAAVGWFETALDADPSNLTARYNLACAQAVANKPEAAVESLKLLPREGLAARILKDTDFDAVRSTPVFKTFLGTLE